jgi:hypothetical protein
VEKRDSSTACPGASRKSKGAGHSAQNDEIGMQCALEGYGEGVAGLFDECIVDEARGADARSE